MSEPKNEQLPEWARELVSDDVAWECHKPHTDELFWHQDDSRYSFVVCNRYENPAWLRIFDIDDEDSSCFIFPFPKAAIQASEAFIRGLKP